MSVTIRAIGEEPPHIRRTCAALLAQSIPAIQTGETVWEAMCPSCLDGRLEILDVDWGENGERRARLCCNRCKDEAAIVKALGLRHGDLALDPAELEATEDLGNAPVVQFVSVEELQASVPPEPPWRWHGYLAGGALTALAGKPKAGKSTLGLAVAAAVADGRDGFLGHAIDGGPVVYVSEEGNATLRHKVGNSDALRLATRDTAWPRPLWPDLVAQAAAEAERMGAVLVVVDTFAFWAGLGPEAEKDAGAVQAMMEPLVALARTGLAVLLVVHARKGGGEDGEAVRGSSALAGAADIILELERIGDMPRQRKLLALSRYPQTPGALVLEHDRGTGSWSVVGEGTDRGDARDIANRGALLAALSYDEELPRKDLEEAIGAPARQWHTTLEQLIESGHVVRSGAGKKGDPFRFKKVRNGAAQHCAETGPGGVLNAAAHPVGVQHQNHNQTANADSAGWAETNGIDADAELERLAAKWGDELP